MSTRDWGMKKLEREDEFWEITPVRPNTGHTHFNAIKQLYYRKTLKCFENVCVMIKIQLHTKPPLRRPHTEGNPTFFLTKYNIQRNSNHLSQLTHSAVNLSIYRYL